MKADRALALLWAMSMLLIGIDVQSEPLTNDQLSKATAIVIERAKAGQSQRLMVSLHDESIDQRGKRLTLDERRIELQALKREVFPNGRLEEVEVEQDFSESAVLVIRVKTLKDLELLLRHPKIKSAHEIRIARPA